MSRYDVCGAKICHIYGLTRVQQEITQLELNLLIVEICMGVGLLCHATSCCH